jgi:predicted Holliday junction resolvase-like endonuclease
MIVLILLLAVVVFLLYRRAASAEARERTAQERVSSVEEQLRALTERHAGDLNKRASRAVAASRGSYDGHVAQQAFPAAPDHPYNPKDIFHFGGVVDYIVFDGLHDIRHLGRDPEALTIVLVDVKWGGSRVSDAQQAVLTAMSAGRTRGETWAAKGAQEGGISYAHKELR